MSTNWYCPLPFKHAYVDSTGVAACCQTPRQPVAMETWADNKFLKKLQSTILAGNIPTECQGCVKQEQTQGRSLRTDSIKDYNNQRFTTTAIDFIDYRSNNVCNFKCRTCEPVYSHLIANEVNNNSTLQKFFKVTNSKTVHITDDNAAWVKDNIESIERLMITGGEPTIMPGVKDIVERIVYDQLDVRVLITTNASFVDDFWCEATRLHKNLHWTVSLDAVGASAEIIRHGTKWPIVERNIRWLAQHSSSMDINTVVSNLNVVQLKPLLNFVNELQHESRYPRGHHGSNGIRHQFHICQRPFKLAANNWPPEMQPQVIEYLQDCLTMSINDEQSAMINGLLNSIKFLDFDPALWRLGQLYNLEIDKIRNQDYNTLYNITKDLK